MASQFTIAVHAGRSDFKELGVHAPPIDLSTTTPLSDIEAGGDSYENLAMGGVLQPGASTVYRRLWNPTVARFEEAVAALETPTGDQDIQGVAFSTGMAGITAVLLSRLRAGKPHVVAVRPLYGGTDHLLNAGILGNRVTYAAAGEISRAIVPETGLIVVESPANPTLQLVDLKKLVADSGGVPVLVDNTFATPILQQPLSLGVTYAFHSATKYIGGHGDAMCGIIVCKEEDAVPLRQMRAITGALLDPFSAFLLHRGIQTLPIRIREQQRNAEILAQHFTAIPAISRVYFPGLPGMDPEGLIGRQMSGPGAMISIELVGGIEAATILCQNLQLVTHAVSLGGTDTLIQHPAALTHRPVESSAKPSAGLLRISVGLEGIEDLIEDFDSAFAVSA
jgi:cystathionine beta-lyase/cystathionine gamma-synthase